MTEKKAPKKRHAEELSETPTLKKVKFAKPTNKTSETAKNPKNKGIAANPKKAKPFNKQDGKPVDWEDFKKKKKELRMKRRENRCVDDIRDVLPKIKQLDEKIRIKTLRGGKEERDKLLNEIHSLLSKRDVYAKLVLAHDTARIVQHILKYGSTSVRAEVSKVCSCTFSFCENPIMIAFLANYSSNH